MSNKNQKTKLRYFIVAGRIPGRDEDSIHAVHAKNQDDAVAQFKDLLLKDATPADRKELSRMDDEELLNAVISSDSPITIDCWTST